MLTIFRILTFILIPVAVLFGFMAVVMFFVALANLPLLLGVFIIASCVIYVFASLKFMNKGLDRRQHCKPSLRDWIRVNAFVSLYMSISTIFTCIRYFLTDKEAVKRQFSEALAMQTNVPRMMNPELLYSVLRISLYFMLIVSLTLLAHIIINFILMKKYRYLFAEKPAE